MIWNIIFSLVTILASYFILKYNYKKCENVIEKSFYIAFVFIIIFVDIVYVLDSNNIPTLLHWNKNVNTQNWLNHVMTIASAIFAEVIGGLILLFITKMQIEESNNFNLKRDKEERRINNMPLLSYNFLDHYTELNNRYILPSIYKDGKLTEIVLKVKNIGMNAMRKCYIKLDGDSLEKDCYCQLDMQSSLDKGDEKIIDFVIALPSDIFKYNITMYYEDLLHNWYKQKIELDYEVTTIFNSVSNYVKYSYEVMDEEIIKKPKIKFNIDKY